MEEILFCKGGGCTAKLGAGVLERVLSRLPKNKDDNLLVGFDASDDAAVYQLTEDLAMVQTLDFFPPMIEDPYLFGQIAATNALSDIYAMGGEVKTALNIVCFPEQMDLNILGKIMQGGNEKVMEAGAVLAGGHSINDADVKYGLSVSGIVNPNKIWKNDGVKEGDILILTKPLGVGIVCTANRIGQASKEAMTHAVDSMRTLNKYAADILREYPVHACTDVTGFGLAVHMREMVKEHFTAVVLANRLPYFKECRKYIDEFYLTAAAQKNRNFAGEDIVFEDSDFATEELVFDPQTSGGLLISVDAVQGMEILKEMQKQGIYAEMIGKIEKRKDHAVHVKGRIENGI